MNGWLIFLIVIAIAIGAWIYGSRWYYRQSGMPEMLTASYAYQTLEYMDFFARRIGQDPAEFEVHMDGVIVPYMLGRKLDWRQRHDVIDYMKEMGWVYEINNPGIKSYVISRVGKRELETADGLRGAVKEAAETLHDEGISSDQAKVTAAAVIAAALRVDAHSAPPESREQAGASADEIEEAVRARDPSKIDRRIARTRDILQIMTYSLPFAREILRILGSL
jgi:hypothetical protein